MRPQLLSDADLAYIAGILDSQGSIAVRTTKDQTDLPQLSVCGSNIAMLKWLGELTGVRPVITRRQYSKAGCAEHCREKHLHVTSTSGRWQVSGAKATIVLAAVRGYLRWHGAEAAAAVQLGMAAPFKTATPEKMSRLGWPIPESWRVAA